MRAFYAQVPTDDILGPMYPPEDLAGAEERLRDFLVGRFGEPPRYIEQRGHPRLRMRHAPFKLDQRARDCWLQQTVSKLLGHADIKTTQIYAHLAPGHLQQAIALLNPPKPATI